MGVHYTDIFAYYHGELETVFGSAFVAEPLRSLPPGSPPVAGIEEVAPGVIEATGEDSLVALYETASGVLIQLCYLPSGPGRRWVQRSVHGRRGSMTVPPDRSGGAVRVQLGDLDAERGRAAKRARRLRARRRGGVLLRPGGDRVRPSLRRGRRRDDRHRARRLRPCRLAAPAAGGGRPGRPSRGGRSLGGGRVADHWRRRSRSKTWRTDGSVPPSNQSTRPSGSVDAKESAGS